MKINEKGMIILETTKRERKTLCNFVHTLENFCSSRDDCDNCPYYYYKDNECPISNGELRNILEGFHIFY